MKVKISVISENLKLGETKLTNVAYFTYVALGDDGRPVTVPRLSPETQEEQDAFDCEQRSHEQKMDCGCH